ncbi:MAG: hypothetical protein ACO3M5_00165 [Saprospiraceae bacterium]|jgi:hypothetical protein
MEKITMLYFSNEEWGCGVRIDPKTKDSYAKYPGNDEYKIDFETNTVQRAMVYGEKITEDEYNNYVGTLT